MTSQDVLQQCTVEGTTVKLPAGQLDRKLYQEVAKALELIGGKWKGGKTMGFVFTLDPTELLEQIGDGEKRNLKKEFQFFATPAAVADKIVAMAQLKSTDTIVEPSAGSGAIIAAIHRLLPGKEVHAFELMDINRSILVKLPNVKLAGEPDFLEADKFGKKWDKIIANPPFNKNQDIDHVYKMYERLKPGGRIVTITSTHWSNSSNKKELDFKLWLGVISATVETLPAGTFKESGTNIETHILTINKN